ncbi:O-methyltransferase [Candidatus Poriferisocius sp.]|uniref:O-methyltransferase n=1 Tax=Candidatus Poriferisocius sp. TaxID=3101276 RepID=UPI003B0126C8
MKPVPLTVLAAENRAAEQGFEHSCERGVGEILAVLAATTPLGGRILELGTGFGVGLAWILTGLGSRTDVEVVSIERDAERVSFLTEVDLPVHVSIVEGDIGALLPALGRFDLIFADAEAGKWTGLELTFAALAPQGLLLVDDMDLSRYGSEKDRSTVEKVRKVLTTDSRLAAVELDVASGIILASRRGAVP